MGITDMEQLADFNMSRQASQQLIFGFPDMQEKINTALEARRSLENINSDSINDIRR